MNEKRLTFVMYGFGEGEFDGSSKQLPRPVDRLLTPTFVPLPRKLVQNHLQTAGVAGKRVQTLLCYMKIE